jgi:hypothetical protein
MKKLLNIVFDENEIVGLQFYPKTTDGNKLTIFLRGGASISVESIRNPDKFEQIEKAYKALSQNAVELNLE